MCKWLYSERVGYLTKKSRNSSNSNWPDPLTLNFINSSLIRISTSSSVNDMKPSQRYRRNAENAIEDHTHCLCQGSDLRIEEDPCVRGPKAYPLPRNLRINKIIHKRVV